MRLPERGPFPHDYFAIPSDTVDVAFQDTAGRDWRITTHHKVAGSGPALVLVHGLMTSSYSWRYVISDLAKRYRVFVPDLVGSGATEKPCDFEYSVANVGRFIAAYVRTLPAAPYLVGNSLGGLYCTKAILDAPPLVRRFVLIHSPGYPMLRTKLAHPALGLFGGVAARIMHRIPRLIVAKNVHYERKDMLSQEEVREYAKLFETREGCRAFVRILRESLNPSEHAAILEQLRKTRPFPCPALLVFARRDVMVPPAFGPRWAEDMGAPLHWVDDASHFVHVDQPKKAVEEIVAFDEGK